jgi:hypothetical protein
MFGFACLCSSLTHDLAFSNEDYSSQIYTFHGISSHDAMPECTHMSLTALVIS